MGIKDIQIDEAGVIALLKMETEQKLRRVAEELGIEGRLEPGGQGKADGTVVSPGLKLRRKSDNALMTVDQIGGDMIRLRTPDGELYDILSAELDEEFELD